MYHDHSRQGLRVCRFRISQMAENDAGVSRELNIGDIEIRRIGRNAGIYRTGRRVVGLRLGESA